MCLIDGLQLMHVRKTIMNTDQMADSLSDLPDVTRSHTVAAILIVRIDICP